MSSHKLILPNSRRANPDAPFLGEFHDSLNPRTSKFRRALAVSRGLSPSGGSAGAMVRVHPDAALDKAAETKFYQRQTATITVAPAISHGMIK